MKTRILLLLLAGSVVALAAWYVNAPKPTPDPVERTAGAEGGKPEAAPEKYQDTIQKGLAYLAMKQCDDGHWEGDDGKHPVAMTGLAGLALLMEKRFTRSREEIENFPNRKYGARVRKAVDWLIDQSRAERGGLIFSEHPSETSRYMEGHGLATLFLAAAYEEEQEKARRKKIGEVLVRAVKYIVKAQSSQGGWYHTSRAEGHDLDAVMPTAIQIQALRAGENVGIPVPDGTIAAGQEYLATTLGRDEEKNKLGKDNTRATETAAALACRVYFRPGALGEKDELRQRWFKYCLAEIPVGHACRLGRDELAHYYYAQAFYLGHSGLWDGYRSTLFDHLQSNQNKDGSWPAGNGLGVGPVYSTAVWCTILQLDNGRHPAREHAAAIG